MRGKIRIFFCKFPQLAWAHFCLFTSIFALNCFFPHNIHNGKFIFHLAQKHIVQRQPPCQSQQKLCTTGRQPSRPFPRAQHTDFCRVNEFSRVSRFPICIFFCAFSAHIFHGLCLGNFAPQFCRRLFRCCNNLLKFFGHIYPLFFTQPCFFSNFGTSH